MSKTSSISSRVRSTWWPRYTPTRTGRYGLGPIAGCGVRRQGQFFAYGPEHGVPPVIGQVLEGTEGELWLAWGEGLTRIEKSQLNAVADGTASRVEYRSLGRAAGLRTVLISDGGRAVRLPNGLLAFAADSGVVLVDPVELPPSETPPPVAIERLVLNGERLGVSRAAPGANDRPELRLPPGYNRLEIHYAGLSFLSPGKGPISSSPARFVGGVGRRDWKQGGSIPGAAPWAVHV